MTVIEHLERLRQERADEEALEKSHTDAEKMQQQAILEPLRTENSKLFDSFLDSSGLDNALNEIADEIGLENATRKTHTLEEDGSQISISLTWPVVKQVSTAPGGVYTPPLKGLSLIYVEWKNNNWFRISGDEVELNSQETPFEDAETVEEVEKAIARAYLNPGWQSNWRVNSASSPKSQEVPA